MTDTNAGENQSPTNEPRSEGRSRPADDREPNRAGGEPDTGGSDRARTGGTDSSGGPVDGRSRSDGGDGGGGEDGAPDGDGAPRRRRRRRSRGGKGRSGQEGVAAADAPDGANTAGGGGDRTGAAAGGPPANKPKIGDTRPAPVVADADDGGRRPSGGRGGGSRSDGGGDAGGGGRSGGRGRGGNGGNGGDGRNRGGGGASKGGSGGGSRAASGGAGDQDGSGGGSRRRRRRRGRNRGSGQGGQGGDGRASQPVTAITDGDPIDLDEKTLSRRRGKERKGKPVGRYLMAVHVQEQATQISVLEGKKLIEHHVSRPADEVTQIHGNIYLGRVQNVLPGMEAAFVDIGTPKNAVLYRGDTRIDPRDVDERSSDLRIEQMLQPKQAILCQVTKNPIGHKGARLTQEVSLPGRFVVLVPHSGTYGISKRLPDNERKRLRQILDKIRPKGHGLIVRTAAEGISAQEIRADVERLTRQWADIEKLAANTRAPSLIYRDPDLAIRVIREEFDQDYRQVVIDDEHVFEQVRDYMRSISPALVDRVELYDPAGHGGLSILETHHIHEQLHKALDRKVWLPSGGSLVIERTEALTVIDVNTGKNVGKSNLEETVYRNNLEAADEVARQLRLRDIGGIIVIDFIDMEEKAHRDDVMVTFRRALARDKTRTQVFDISELGLVEMTRKRIGEGLLESLSVECPACEGRGLTYDEDLVRS